MDVKKVAGLVTALGTIVGAVVITINFFQTKAEAAEQGAKHEAQLSAAVSSLLQKQDKDRARSDLKSAEIKLSLLTAKQKPSTDDLNEIDFLRDEVKRLRAELAR